MTLGTCLFCPFLFVVVTQKIQTNIHFRCKEEEEGGMSFPASSVGTLELGFRLDSKLIELSAKSAHEY